MINSNTPPPPQKKKYRLSKLKKKNKKKNKSNHLYDWSICTFSSSGVALYEEHVVSHFTEEAEGLGVYTH